MIQGCKRTLQRVAEKLCNVEQTEYEPRVKTLLDRVLTGEQLMKAVCITFECLLQPNPSKRFGDSVYDKLNRKIERVSPYQDFGQALEDLGENMGKDDPHFSTIIKLGINEKLMGQMENEFCEMVSKEFYFPIKDIINQDCKTMHQEKDFLEKKRLNYEIVKGKLKKSTKGTPQHEGLISEEKASYKEFAQQQESIYKLLQEIYKKLFLEKRIYGELIEKQIHFHKKCLEFLNNSKDELANLG